jgi:hypothetical protein
VSLPSKDLMENAQKIREELQIYLVLSAGMRVSRA